MTQELSVIIPSYNTDAYICDAVESIVNDVPDAEILVIDDASTDNTVENLNQLNVENLTTVQLEKNTPGGAGIPSNIGIERVQGEYIAFVDSDDFFLKGYLSTLLDKIKDTGADICVGGYTLIDTITHNERKGFGNDRWQRLLKRNPSLLEKDLYFLTSPEPWRKVYRAELFQNTSVRFPENGCVNEDYPFHWYCGLATSRGITYCDVRSYYHRVARMGQTTESFDRRAHNVFEHTQEILSFMQLNPAYETYKSNLLYWLVLGSSWKFKRVKADKNDFFINYKNLLKSFSTQDVSRFKKMATTHYRSVYKGILQANSLDDLFAIMNWKSEYE